MKSKVSSKIVSIILLACMVSSIFCIQTNAASGVVNGTKYERSFNPANNQPVEFDKKQKVIFKHSGDITLPDLVPEKEVVMLIDTSGSLYQRQEGAIDPFEYCLYSGNPSPGSELLFQGNTVVVDGKVHSNSGVILKGQDFKFSYKDEKGNIVNNAVCEYVTGVNKVAYGNYSAVQNCFTQSKYAELPDIKGKLDTFAGTYLKGDFLFNADNYITEFNRYIDALKNSGLPIPQPLDLSISKTKGTNAKGEPIDVFLIGGGSNFWVLPEVKLDFKGSVQFTNGIKFNNYGIVCATNDITLGGEGVFTSVQNEAFFYSVEGNINNTVAMSSFTGTMYAPEGKVTLTGQNIDILGSVLANDIIMYPNSTKITYNPNGKIQGVLSKVFPVPTYYDDVYNQAKAFINNMATDIKTKNYKAPVKIGILTYDSTANNDNYTNEEFYSSTGVPQLRDINNYTGSVFNDSAKNDLIRVINEIGYGVVDTFETAKKVKDAKDLDPRIGKSNLGDGLRRAKSFFSNRPNVSKTVIVFAGSSPNTWTSKSNGVSIYTGTGDVGTSGSKYINEGNIKIDSEAVAGKDIKFTLSKSYWYAFNRAKDLVNNNIVPIFINSLPNNPANKDAYKLNDFAFKTLESDILAMDILPVSTKLYYDAQSNQVTLNEIIDNITKIVEEDKPPIVTKMVMTFTIPEDARYLYREFGFDVVSNEDVSTSNPHKFKYVANNYTLTYDKATGKYKLPDTEFYILVKYVLKKPIPKEAKGQVLIDMPYEVKIDNITKMPNDPDNMASFEVEYYETGKDTPTKSVIESYLNSDKVTVVYKKDIT